MRVEGHGVKGTKGYFETTSDFWDCDCTEGYIHESKDTVCEVCGAHKETSPDSRVLEVQEAIVDLMLARFEDGAINL